MRESLRAGLSPSEFWAVTPHEAIEAIEAYRSRQLDDRDRAVMTAWLTEAYARHKKLPDLERVLRRKGAAASKAPEMTPDQEAAVFELWAKQHNEALKRQQEAKGSA